MKLALVRFGKYTLVGTVIFVLDLGLLFLLVDTFLIPPVFAAGLAFIVAVSLNYFVSRKFVFSKTRREVKIGYLTFLLIAGVGLLLVTGGMYVLLHLGVQYLLARVIIATVTGFWNYMMNLYVNFNVAGIH